MTKIPPEDNLLNAFNRGEDQLKKTNSINPINNKIHSVKQDLMKKKVVNGSQVNSRDQHNKVNESLIAEEFDKLKYYKDEITNLESIKIKSNIAETFFDQKEELFDHTLPPEVMGGTPEFQKEEEYELPEITLIKEIPNNEQNDGTKTNIPNTLGLINSEVTNINLINKKCEAGRITSNSITTTILNSSQVTGNILKKKQNRIIDDEDEEEIINPTYYIENNPEIKQVNNICNNKIKISFADITGIVSPNEINKSQSSKSNENNKEKEKENEYAVNKKEKTVLAPNNNSESITKTEKKIVTNKLNLNYDVIEIDKTKLNLNVQNLIDNKTLSNNVIRSEIKKKEPIINKVSTGVSVVNDEIKSKLNVKERSIPPVPKILPPISSNSSSKTAIPSSKVSNIVSAAVKEEIQVSSSNQSATLRPCT